MEHLKALKELCETLSKELEKANDKIRASGGSLTPADVEFVDKLTHSIKSVKTTIAMMEAEDEDGQGSYMPGSYMPGGYSRYGRPEYSNAGRRNPRRDGMGRYSRERGYSRDGDMLSELYDLMEKAPDERTRQEMQRMIDRMESM